VKERGLTVDPDKHFVAGADGSENSVQALQLSARRGVL
jgi:hypothetical protein